MTVRILTGDCRDVLKTLPDASVDSIVTDPPYGLEFMGVAWDTFTDRSKGRARPRNEWGDFGSREHARHPSEAARIQRKKGVAFQEFSEAWAREALRVLKPGGYLLAFSGTRTYHRMACAIEDAGFEIRDQIGWAYGSGFPKSLDVSKAIDKAAGAEREVVGSKIGQPGYSAKPADEGNCYGDGLSNGEAKCVITAPATGAASQWQGWGTALKPAWEPICVARKPLVGTVAENVLTHGTGALNIDGCRVPTDPTDPTVDELGRWPANLIHDGSDEVLAAFPNAPGQSGAVTGDEPSSKTRNTFALYNGRSTAVPRNDTGSAARFFYCAKADRNDRGEGNTHPTVKPGDLMRYLVRLVTPPGGTVLDPFAGSGSTLLAADREGFNAIGIELDPQYAEMARKRIHGDAPLFAEVAGG